VQDLFSLKDGSVVELQRMVDDPVDVLLNGRVVARGQLVASGDQFGVRVTEILGGEN
jgi:flagellar motor switch protein FliN/FliY